MALVGPGLAHTPVVDREGAQDRAVGTTDWVRPRGDQAVVSCQIPVVTPERVVLGIGDDHRLVAVCGRAAGSDALTYGNTLDRLCIALREVGRRREMKRASLRIEEQHRAEPGLGLLFDLFRQGLQHLEERLAPADPLQNLLLSGEKTLRAPTLGVLCAQFHLPHHRGGHLPQEVDLPLAPRAWLRVYHAEGPHDLSRAHQWHAYIRESAVLGDSGA